jgi:nitrite reductase (NADH) large subunit
MERMGFSFYLGVRPKEIQGSRGKAQGLLLEDGRFLEADLILISAGVRPHLELAEGLGLKIQRGIVVNDEMETSSPGVYAAGDAVEHRGVYYGIWNAAEEQGRVAGVNLAGGGARYQGTLMSNRLKVVGIDLVSAGEIDTEGVHFSEVKSDPDKGIYRKLVYKEDRIIGCILLGDVRGQRQFLQALTHGTDVGELKGKLLSQPEKLGQK